MSQNILSTYTWIQYHILAELTRHTTRRYNQLRPSDIEGNVFSYHLKRLINENLITKNENHYQLTSKGLLLISTLSLETCRPRKQPQILVAIAAQNKSDEYLWSRWQRQPNTGLVSLPHGMMHFGESLIDMAARELAEKAGLEANLDYRGEVYVRAFQHDTIDRHMLVHIFQASHIQSRRENEQRQDINHPFWARLDTIPRDEFLPGFYEIVQLIEQQPTHIFADIIVGDILHTSAKS